MMHHVNFKIYSKMNKLCYQFCYFPKSYLTWYHKHFRKNNEMMIYIWDYSLAHIKTHKPYLIGMEHVLVSSVIINSVFVFSYSFLCFTFTCIIHNSGSQSFVLLSQVRWDQKRWLQLLCTVFIYLFILPLIILFIGLIKKKFPAE